MLTRKFIPPPTRQQMEATLQEDVEQYRIDQRKRDEVLEKVSSSLKRFFLFLIPPRLLFSALCLALSDSPNHETFIF